MSATMGTMSAPDAAPLPRLGEVFFDVRGSSRTMRLSWYADTGVAVLSIWQGGMCTGTFRLAIADLPRMVETLQRGPGQPPSSQDPAAPAQAFAERSPHATGQVHERSAGEQAAYATEAIGYPAEPAGYRTMPADNPAQPPAYAAEATGSPGGFAPGEPQPYPGEPAGYRTGPVPAHAEPAGYPEPAGYAEPAGYPAEQAGFAADPGAYPAAPPAYQPAAADYHGEQPAYPAEQASRPSRPARYPAERPSRPSRPTGYPAEPPSHPNYPAEPADGRARPAHYSGQPGSGSTGPAQYPGQPGAGNTRPAQYSGQSRSGSTRPEQYSGEPANYPREPAGDPTAPAHYPAERHSAERPAYSAGPADSRQRAQYPGEPGGPRADSGYLPQQPGYQPEPTRQWDSYQEEPDDYHAASAGYPEEQSASLSGPYSGSHPSHPLSVGHGRHGGAQPDSGLYSPTGQMDYLDEIPAGHYRGGGSAHQRSEAANDYPTHYAAIVTDATRDVDDGRDGMDDPAGESLPYGSRPANRAAVSRHGRPGTPFD